MFLRIPLLLRRREQIVLRIVVDHRFRQRLIFLIPFVLRKIFIHERRHLIHIKLNRRKILRCNIAKLCHFPYLFFQAVLFNIHIIYAPNAYII